MPALIALGFALFVMLAAIALMPLALLRRYRVGTSRRLARGWMIGLNMWGMVFSTLLYLLSAGVTNIWVPGALKYAALGAAAGGALGILGLALTRWERSPGALYYTPNRLLVLTITLVVTARLLYGMWRAWETWRVAADGSAWLVTSGVPQSLAAGALVLGYYTIYWAGVRGRMNRLGVARG